MTRSGEVFYDFDRDAPKPQRVLSEKAVSEMNSMLVQVPEIGTARRAALPNIRSAGKTGTTQSYRDAWYVGFTGNYTAAVWLGNDDFHPTRNMTGGSLPAMTWQRLMEYAHKNIDLKPIPGIENPFVDEEIAAKAAEAEKREADKNAQEAHRAARRCCRPRRPGCSRKCRSASAQRRRSTRRRSPRRCRRSDVDERVPSASPCGAASVLQRRSIAPGASRSACSWHQSPGYPLTAPSPASSASCSEPFS